MAGESEPPRWQIACVWGKVIHRGAAEGASPEQVIDEAIARLKQLLNE